MKNITVKEYKLGDVCEIITGFAFLSDKYKKSGQPIIRAMNVKNNKIDYSSLVYFDEADYSKDLSKYTFKPGDIAMTRFGSFGKMVFNQTDKVFYLTHNFSKLEPNPEILDKKYLFHVLITKSKEINESSVVGMIPRLNLDAIKGIKIPVPSLEAQRKIAESFDKFDEIEREIDLRQKQYEYYRELLIRS